MIIRDFYEGALRETAVCDCLFEKEYDVIVAGLGTAGAIAAITAAREGLKVFGIEQLNIMGGTGTSGGIWSYYTGNKGGLYKEADKLAEELFAADLAKDEEGSVNPHNRFRGQSGQYKAEALMKLCDRAGVEYVFSASVTGVAADGKKITGVRWFDGVKSHLYGAKFVIDCTAEGCVCIAAGCEMNPGRESDLAFQPYSNIMVCLAENGLHFANTDSGTLDHYDPKEYGYASLYSAATPMFLQEKYYPGWRFVGLAPLLGIREGKTVVGEEMLTLPHLMEELAHGEDGSAVFYGMSHIDDHSQDLAYGSREYCEIMSVCGLWDMRMTFGMPMGSMIPKGFDGLLCAGRMISVDHAVAQAMRMKDDIQKSGEAAAQIAALAIRDKIAAKDVDRDELRERLRTTGCLKDGDRVKLMATEDGRFPTDPGDFKAAFATDKPGLYIMAARYMPDSFGDTLAEWLSADDAKVRMNAALALSMRGDLRAIPVLLEMAESREGYTAETSPYAPSHALAAVAALGLMGIKEAVPMLYSMLDLNYAKGIPFKASSLVQDETASVYQYFTHAHMALLRIAEAEPAMREEIMAKLNEAINAPDFRLNVGLRYTGNVMSDRTQATKNVQIRAMAVN